MAEKPDCPVSSPSARPDSSFGAGTPHRGAPSPVADHASRAASLQRAGQFQPEAAGLSSLGNASILRSGTLYFALVFGAGFLLGSIRVPFLVPRLGERAAELLETPFMLSIIFLASRYVVDRFRLAARASILVGLLALALLACAELGLGALMGRDVLDRDPVSGSVFLASLLVYAALPWRHARRSANPHPQA